MTRLGIELTASGVVILMVAALLLIQWKMPRRLKVENYLADWRQLQEFCKDKSTWHQALIDADKLLCKALKKRKYKGKRMGERLVAAQRKFSNNDGIWAAHNLSKKVADSPGARLQEAKVKSALIAYRQALIDIGALPNGQSRNS